MGMKVIGFDPVMTPAAFTALGSHIIRAASVNEIWAKSDFLTFHTPLTPETSNLFNDTTIAKCKKGIRVVNCARGGIGEFIHNDNSVFKNIFHFLMSYSIFT
jgi:D-3-phosphoglycerate dehydrogenase